ncbi:nitrite reductase (NAD(P)H) small subunit [Agilicoccus flavus]|uniref:nitrite reductase (NAD(P)H) small subunit n=1 Tax=Agilicoccus flavus TaxID=2775968 RepID=UPI0027DA7F73|nr:nitrite reductase (NAD(P)H) small subunit [Agilicoccus flavus]
MSIATDPTTAPARGADGATDVCALSDLLPERAAAALVDGVQIALVRLPDDSVHAVGQHDPYCGANVMSRGLVGSTWVDGVEVATLQSPMYKQAFAVATGRAVADPSVRLGSWEVHVRDGRVLVGACTEAPAGPGAAGALDAIADADAAARGVVDSSS